MKTEEQKTKDLRERLANPSKDKWYDNIALYLFEGSEEIFMPDEKGEDIKVFGPQGENKSNYEGNFVELFQQLNDHSLLIYGDVCDFLRDDIDICISLPAPWSRPTKFLIKMIETCFKEQGYQVGINEPCMNVIAPKLACNYDAINIYVNQRRLKNDDARATEVPKLHQILVALYGLLTKYWEEV